MPYKSNSELPKGVRNHLPDHAQTIYREAFDNAWKQYASPEKRKLGGTQEEAASRVAWAAVEKKYEKNKEGVWVEKK
jgi:cation transport regulator